MKYLFLLTFSLQALFMMLDEFYFHWKRNLPRWERLGHPVDTFFFLLPLSMATFLPFSTGISSVYIFLSVISCLIITKDEWIHREKASGTEQWLHSILFLVHPVVLSLTFFVWRDSHLWLLPFWLSVFLFGLYQLLFWNLYADRILKARL